MSLILRTIALIAGKLLIGQINPQSTAPLLLIIIHTISYACEYIPSVRRGVEVISIPRHKKYDYTFAKRLEQIMRERQLYPAQVEKLTGIRRQQIYEKKQNLTKYTITK